MNTIKLFFNLVYFSFVHFLKNHFHFGELYTVYNLLGQKYIDWIYKYF